MTAAGKLGGAVSSSPFRFAQLCRSLRRPDEPAIHNYLRVTMINIHDEFSKRMDAPALASALSTEAAR